MTKPTYQEQIELDRFARKQESNLKFLRESPRDQKYIPFADEEEFWRPSWGEVALWMVVLVALFTTIYKIFEATPK